MAPALGLSRSPWVRDQGLARQEIVYSYNRVIRWKTFHTAQQTTTTIIDHNSPIAMAATTPSTLKPTTTHITHSHTIPHTTRVRCTMGNSPIIISQKMTTDGR